MLLSRTRSDHSFSLLDIQNRLSQKNLPIIQTQIDLETTHLLMIFRSLSAETWTSFIKELVALSFKSKAEMRCEALFCERSFHLSIVVLKFIFAHTQPDQISMLVLG